MRIEIKGLSKKFKNKQVIKNLDFCINEGDLILIQGINGCGKSTLLKIIAGLMSYDDGCVKFEKQLKIGAFIENPNFIENESAEYNMQFLMELTGKFDKDKVESLFKKFYLDINDKSVVKKYSIGMRQKLGIIQAVMENQEMILFDEPTRGLDKASMESFNNLIQELNMQGKTCIICAHDGVSDINFNKIYNMEEGHLIEKQGIEI